MKYLKNTASALYVSLACVCLTSCTNWLDLQPFDQILEEKVFTDEIEMNKAMNGLYLHMADEDLYGQKLSFYTIELLGQRYNFVQSANSNDVKHSLPGFTYTNKDIRTHLDAIFKKAYTVIRDVNNFIEKTEQTQGVISEADKKILLGEAYAVRAFLHFDMLRFYGPPPSVKPENDAIPYYTEASKEWSPIEPSNKILEYILADLDKAITLLQNDDVRTLGVLMGNDVVRDFNKDYRNRRMNYYAAQALKARVLLYQGGEESVEAAGQLAKEIIEADAFTKAFPWSTEDDVFASSTGKDDKVYSKEVLFGIHVSEMYKKWETWFAPSNTSTASLLPTVTNSLLYMYNFSSGNFKTSQDWRAQDWTEWSMQTAASPYWLTTKFRKTARETEFWYFQPLIKKSELYLIAAEAFQETKYLDSVRVHRGLKLIQEEIPTFVISNLNEQIRKEYMKEFVGEGQMFYYYKRRGETSIRGHAGANVTVNPENVYVLPIPQKEKER